MTHRNHLVFLGLSGFPIGMAAIQRQRLIAKGLIENGWDVTVVCPRATHPENVKLKRVGRFEGIVYVYLFGPQRNKNFFIRNSQKLVAPFKEFCLLQRLKSKKGINAAIVSNRNSFTAAIKYRLVSWLLRFKLLINLVEIYKDREQTPLLLKVNDFFFNNFGLYFFDAFLPISEHIRDSFARFNKKNELIPIITDYDYINALPVITKREKPFFLFCGSASYLKSIRFIIEAFSLVKDREVELILVTNGSSAEMEVIHALIANKALKNRVIILKNIPEEELYSLYKTAKALLLPMFNTIQDTARFPHKMAEYLASGTIVISNPIGEVGKYLRNGKSALLSNVNDVIAFSEKMNWIMDNKNQVKEIAENGTVISRNNFDFKVLSMKMSVFLSSI